MIYNPSILKSTSLNKIFYIWGQYHDLLTTNAKELSIYLFRTLCTTQFKHRITGD